MPAYNEANVINDVISSAIKTFSSSSHDIQIVIIDDASTDHTSEIVKKHNVTIIKHIVNSGAGSATATGLSYAARNNFDIAATMDADGQHSPQDVLNGINLIIKLGDDLLIGSRLIDKNGMPKVKIIGNKGLSIITNILFGIKTTDSQSGLRIFSKNALEVLRWKNNGYEFCSEMIWRANQNKLKISEYPIKAIYTDYSKKKGQNNWNGINITKNLIKRRIAEIFG